MRSLDRLAGMVRLAAVLRNARRPRRIVSDRPRRYVEVRAPKPNAPGSPVYEARILLELHDRDCRGGRCTCVLRGMSEWGKP